MDSIEDFLDGEDILDLLDEDTEIPPEFHETLLEIVVEA